MKAEKGETEQTNKNTQKTEIK